VPIARGAGEVAEETGAHHLPRNHTPGASHERTFVYELTRCVRRVDFSDRSSHSAV
jgi:hypothetical protein